VRRLEHISFENRCECAMMQMLPLGKLATHDVLKTTHLTKMAPIFTFLYRATVFCQTAPIVKHFYSTH
jgi:hypothetical protein